MADRYEKQVILNNEAYNLGRNNQASPILLYTYVCDGFTCAALGHPSAQNQDSKELFIECGEKFAQTCEKLQRNFEFCQPQSGEWKKRQNFEKWVKSGDFVKWMNNEESI